MTREDRYGSNKLSRRNKILGVSIAGLMLLGGVTFLATGGMPSDAKEIEFRDIIIKVEDENQATLTYEVTTGANKDIVCAIDALSPSYATVGIKFVEIPASETRTRVFTESVRTAHLSTTITVRHCWIA